MKKLNRVIMILGIFLMLDVIAFGIVAIFDRRFEPIVNVDTIRLGITPDPDRLETEKTIDNFFRVLSHNKDFDLRPCYTTSFDEAIAGFINGTVDLLYINPAYFLYLKKEYDARGVVFQRYSKQEMEYNHAILLSTKPLKHISDSRGLKIAFTSKYSMGGYLVPHKHLINNINEDLDKWFSKIEFTGSNQYSLEAMLDGKVDIMACDLMSITHNKLYKRNAAKLHILWVSQKLPESLICVSIKSLESELYSQIALDQFANSLWKLSRMESLYNRNSMNFVPVNYEYEQELKKLEKFLFSTKNNKK